MSSHVNGTLHAVYIPNVGRAASEFVCERDLGMLAIKSKENDVCFFVIVVKACKEGRGNAIRRGSQFIKESRTKEEVGKGEIAARQEDDASDGSVSLVANSFGDNW